MSEYCGNVNPRGRQLGKTSRIAAPVWGPQRSVMEGPICSSWSSNISRAQRYQCQIFVWNQEISILRKHAWIRLTIASILIYADEILLCNQNKSMILLCLISSPVLENVSFLRMAEERTGGTSLGEFSSGLEGLSRLLWIFLCRFGHQARRYLTKLQLPPCSCKNGKRDQDYREPSSRDHKLALWVRVLTAKANNWV